MYLPLIPRPLPRPNLDRPVWGPYNALRPYRSRGKEAAAATSFPLGEGLGWTNVQPRLRLYPDSHFTRGWGKKRGFSKNGNGFGGRTVCPRGLSFSEFIVLMST